MCGEGTEEGESFQHHPGCMLCREWGAGEFPLLLGEHLPR